MPASPDNVDLVRAGGLIGLETLVRDLGGDLAAGLRRHDMKPADLADPDRFLRYSSAVLAIEAMAADLGVPDFGLRLSALQDLEFYGFLWLIIQSAPTVREGVLLGIKHVSFHIPAQGYRNFSSADGRLECVEMFQRVPDLPSLPQTAENAVGHLHRIVLALSDDKLRPTEIHFRHRPIGSDAQYLQHFGIPPHFESEFDGIALSPTGFRQPIAVQSPLLRQFVARFLVGVTPDHTQTTTQQVAALLHNLVRANMAELATVAAVMGQHPRTLQRRLSAESTGFEVLRDKARKDWAYQLLMQRGLSLVQVGDMLGFSDQSVLTRACQRWFGTTPLRLRQEMLSGATERRAESQ